MALKSISAFVLYWLARMSRIDPERSAAEHFSEWQWKIIFALTHPKNAEPPNQPPKCRDVIRWIAMRGGFLGRAGDGEPGMISVWRGWHEIELAFEFAKTLELYRDT